MACQNTANATSTSTSKCTSISNSDFKFYSNINLIPVQEISRNGKPGLKFGSSSAARQSTLDKFVVIPSNNSSKLKFTDGFHGNNSNSNNDGDEINGVAECYDIETLNGCLQIDPEAAKTWIYPGFLNIVLSSNIILQFSLVCQFHFLLNIFILCWSVGLWDVIRGEK